MIQHVRNGVISVLFLMAGGVPSAAAGDYSYSLLDVFTERPLTGNQLAVFLEPGALTADQMMDVTREMAFSETSFVFPAETPETAFRVRIFANNTGGEIPVAGHPTVGTVFALAEQGKIPAGTAEVVLGLGIGPTPVELEWAGERLRFAWMTQRLPTFTKSVDDVAGVAAALGISASDIVEGLPLQEVSCGAPFLMVPLKTRAAVDRSKLDRASMGAMLDARGMTKRGIFVFSQEPGEDGATIYSRMFGFGVIEDPATGNASGPVGSYLFHHELISAEQAKHIVSRQGVAMHRPSEVHIRIDTEGKEITGVSVGGSSVIAGRGMVRVP